MTHSTEAREWLKNLPDETAFASARFDTTAEALDFVYKLYRAGAVSVHVLHGTPEELDVALPPERLFRRGVLDVCNAERAHCGAEPLRDERQGSVRLSWVGMPAPVGL